MLNFGVNVAVVRGGQVLLTLRTDLPVWCLPGGAIEPRETLVEAAIRETWEETGVEVEVMHLVGVYSRPNWFAGNHEMLFSARPINGDPVPQDGEAARAGFFRPAVLPAPLLWWHERRIFDALSGKTGIIAVQNVRWPLPDISNEEAYTLLQDGKLQIDELVDFFCTPP